MPDLERAVGADPTYDFHRGIGLLAHAYAETGQAEKAGKLFEQATQISTSSEIYYNYALFLQGQGRVDEARKWVQKILDKPRDHARISAAPGAGVVSQGLCVDGEAAAVGAPQFYFVVTSLLNA